MWYIVINTESRFWSGGVKEKFLIILSSKTQSAQKSRKEHDF